MFMVGCKEAVGRGRVSLVHGDSVSPLPPGPLQEREWESYSVEHWKGGAGISSLGT